MSMEMRVIGIDQFISRLQQLDQRVRSNARDAVNASVLEGQQMAMALSPVRSGYLRSRNQIHAAGGLTNVILYELYNDAPYARFVEWGTRKMRAHPFMTPAVEYARMRLARRLASVVSL
jgi:HK97 gp10 family phage protein